MTQPPDLSKLSHAGKDALILALSARLNAAHERIAALEARLDEPAQPPKTPDNSSKPPSQGQKQDRPDGEPRPARETQQVYERIELPPVRPDVTQVCLFSGRCACCGERVTAEVGRIRDVDEGQRT